MRFVPVNCLKSGHQLASDLVFSENRILLRQGVELTPHLISRLHTLGFQGVYIEDEISKDIHVVSIISDHMKGAVKNKLRHLYVCAQYNWSKRFSSNLHGMNTLISDMVDDILSHKHLLINMVDLRAYDDYTFSHSLNVAVICVVIGTALGLGKSDLHDLALGAIMHDIGKVFIDKDIINKPTKLTDDEYAAVKLHCILGYEYVGDRLGSTKARQVVLSHHEHYDGSGYPNGLIGRNIPLLARITCIADIYDALTSDRPYRRALLPSEAFEFIMGQNNILFEPNIVEAFTRKIVPYPVGTCVRLSTDDIAIVIDNYESSSLRPVVQILQSGKLTDVCIDLTHDASSLNITIKEVINL